MQNKYLKAAILSGIIAVTVGVVLFGVNSAFGAPSASPEASTAVAPTFGGLTSTGVIKANNGLDVQGNIYAAGGADVVIDDWLKVKGNIDVWGGNLKNTGIFGGVGMPLLIDDDLKINGGLKINEGLEVVKDLTVTGNVSGSEISAGKATIDKVVIDDDSISNQTSSLYLNPTGGKLVSVGAPVQPAPLYVYGNNWVEGFLSVSSNLEVKGSISNPTSDPLKINDGLDIAGDLSNNALGRVEVKDTLHVKGGRGIIIDGSNKGGFIKPVAVPLQIQGGLIVDSTVEIKATQDVSPTKTGALKIGDTSAGDTQWLAIDNNEVGTYGDGLYLNWDSGQDVFVGGGNNGVSESNLKVSGKVTAKGFGTYHYIESAVGISIGAGGYGEASLACPTGEMIVSCGAQSTYGIYDIQYTAIFAGQEDNSCYVRGMNQDATAASQFKVHAVCLDPDA